MVYIKVRKDKGDKIMFMVIGKKLKNAVAKGTNTIEETNEKLKKEAVRAAKEGYLDAKGGYLDAKKATAKAAKEAAHKFKNVFELEGFSSGGKVSKK
jgi:hypothetical protein